MAALQLIGDAEAEQTINVIDCLNAENAATEQQRDDAEAKCVRLQAIIDDRKQRDEDDDADAERRTLSQLDDAAERDYNKRLDAHLQAEEDAEAEAYTEQVNAATEAYMLKHWPTCAAAVVTRAAALPVPPHNATFLESMEKIAMHECDLADEAEHQRWEAAEKKRRAAEKVTKPPNKKQKVR